MSQPTLEMPFAAFPSKEVVTGGQPSLRDLDVLKAQGVGTVIDLRAHGEPRAYDERHEVERRGLQYIAIPVAGPPGLTRANAERLRDALAAARGKALVHCASANRVGALFALKAYLLEGKDLESALGVGRAHGMNQIEPVVRQLLGR